MITSNAEVPSVLSGPVKIKDYKIGARKYAVENAIFVFILIIFYPHPVISSAMVYSLNKKIV
jgi:hypothetical protein